MEEISFIIIARVDKENKEELKEKVRNAITDFVMELNKEDGLIVTKEDYII